MAAKDEIVEVAILKCHTHYDSYDDSHQVLARMLDEDWVKMTRGELDVLRQNQYEIARELNVESLVILEKPNGITAGVCFAAIKKIMDKKEAERKAREARAAKARQVALERATEQKVAKAKKALEKAQKVLKEAGQL